MRAMCLHRSAWREWKQDYVPGPRGPHYRGRVLRRQWGHAHSDLAGDTQWLLQGRGGEELHIGVRAPPVQATGT